MRSNGKVGWFGAYWEGELRHSPSFPAEIPPHRVPGAASPPGAPRPRGLLLINTPLPRPQPPLRLPYTTRTSGERTRAPPLGQPLAAWTCGLKMQMAAVPTEWESLDFRAWAHTAEMAHFPPFSEPLVSCMENGRSGHSSPGPGGRSCPVNVKTTLETLWMHVSVVLKQNVLLCMLSNARELLLLMSQVWVEVKCLIIDLNT